MNGELGEFLRTRRAKIGPEAIAVPTHGHRRVPGLRRDEVAANSGVSTDYYRRLEQGRELHPSEQVLAALCDTLKLSIAERKHLYSMAGVALRLNGEEPTAPVPVELLSLMESWPESGALVLDPVLDISAMNSHAKALFDGFSRTTNLLEMVLLDPVARTFFVEWEASAEATVANLRASADFSTTPSRYRDLITDLGKNSPEFKELWARHDVQPKTHEIKKLHHDRMGVLEVEFHAFGVASAPGHQLLVYQVRN